MMDTKNKAALELVRVLEIGVCLPFCLVSPVDFLADRLGPDCLLIKALPYPRESDHFLVVHEIVEARGELRSNSIHLNTSSNPFDYDDTSGVLVVPDASFVEGALAYKVHVLRGPNKVYFEGSS